MTEERQPNEEVIEIDENGVVHDPHNLLKRERQPNTELREAILDKFFPKFRYVLQGTASYSVSQDHGMREMAGKMLDEYAASIQAEAQQQAFNPYNPVNQRSEYAAWEQGTASIRQKCGETPPWGNHDDACTWEKGHPEEWHEGSGLGRLAQRCKDLEKQLAEARAQLAEIHNRFCGENGEPCQVCRLKAEREGK